MLSIVIPTYRRPEILKKCLEHIARQTVVDQLEVVVVSDGEDAKTAALCVQQSYPFPLKYSTVPKSQQGVARNAGVALASGERVLFIGDDIFLEAQACEKHLQSHESRVTSHELAGSRDQSISRLKTDDSRLHAVLGFTTWDPAVGITPVMTWLETSGWQFGYPMISAYKNDCIPHNIQQQFTYTSHISVPLEIAKKYPFRTDVHLYGWEDIEWGMRLKNAGVRLFYEPDAKAFHHHRIMLEDSLKRMETLGRSSVVFEKLVPGFDRRPRGVKLFLYKLMAVFPTMAGRHRKAFLKGIDMTDGNSKNQQTAPRLRSG